MVADREGVLEAIVLAQGALQASMLAVLPSLARLRGSIREAQQRNNGHRGRTAAGLGISVTTPWRHMRRFNSAGADGRP